MGTFIGHVLPGAGFLLIGLWHLFNTITNYARAPWDFHTRPWFPVKFGGGRLKYLELAAIIAGSCLSILAELFIGPERHQPLADDWSIPPQHLKSFEHSSISLFFLIYASVALYGGLSKLTVPPGALQVIAALALSQELLLFHLHSVDHTGIAGHYHLLLQLIVVVNLSATLLEVPFPRSFLVAVVRSASWMFHGAWFINMGFMLWIPAFIHKGCHIILGTKGHNVLKCASQEATMQAKGLANLQFNWYLAIILVSTVIFYARTVRIYEDTYAYQPLEQKPEKKGDAAVEMGTHGVERQHFPDASQSIDVKGSVLKMYSDAPKVLS